jgi:hypothetical protein
MKYYGITKENLDKLNAVLLDLPHRFAVPVVQSLGELKEIEVAEKEEEPKP